MVWLGRTRRKYVPVATVLWDGILAVWQTGTAKPAAGRQPLPCALGLPQAGIGPLEASRTRALRMTSIFRITATMATFPSLPRARSDR